MTQQPSTDGSARAMKTTVHPSGIPYRTLGNTGESVSLIGLGGYHIGIQPTEDESVRLIRTAIDAGINFMDNSWDYNEGASEIRMGKALRDGYRDKVFLMTKIDGQTEKSATDQLDECLRRLQVDTIDLLQFHEVIRLSDPARIFGPAGAFAAAVAARKAGKIRYIGFTGHKSPGIHLEMLRVARDNGFTFDAVQMPVNVLDAHYDSFAEKVLPVLVEEGIGALGMKPLASGALVRKLGFDAVECLRYAMSLPVSVVITGCESPRILRQAIDLARDFTPMTEEERSSLLARTFELGKDGKEEGFKTTDFYDATTRNPDWLG